ncbi:hypothetical protein [Bacillus sp. Marseille-P3661]|uniref:hypothetical protein n=1 Tax=Bacillus sp. Marseille-P3661 TaxID=1936234 RepID=UPI000C84FBC8|nr:hypothetical protein [Bacillus sp. Marseille-P3661]
MNKTVIFLLFIMLSACGSVDQDLTPYKVKNNPEPVSFREGENTDVADLNPNFLDLNTENESHNNIGFYQRKLRSIVEESKHFDGGMIYINGSHAIVNVIPREKFSKDELSRYKKLLEKDLQAAVPRYNVDLRVNKPQNNNL